MKTATAEILGMIAKHDALQQKRVELQSGLAARQAEEGKLATAYAVAARAVQEAEDRIGALRALGDLEGAASLDAETHRARKSAEAADAALTKYRKATAGIHAEILEHGQAASALARTITTDLKGVSDREALGRIDGYLQDITKSTAEAVERNWSQVEAEFRAVRPLLGWWERSQGRENPWAQAIVAGRSVTLRRCIDETGIPAGEVLGRRKR